MSATWHKWKIERCKYDYFFICKNFIFITIAIGRTCFPFLIHKLDMANRREKIIFAIPLPVNKQTLNLNSNANHGLKQIRIAMN